ncbi:DUF4421 family protein [Robiginitalea sp. IMCC44478]|uniref:DUF4421 family protein n=1 Tax=Robiginitalea sp. IMCC44478 TaxID=3459122 RepID=UPI0040417EBE
MGLKALFKMGLTIPLATVYGQWDSLPITSGDYIQSFPNKITFRTSIVNTGNSFFYRDPNQDLTLKLNPGIRNYLGFTILFRSLEIDYGFAPGFLNERYEVADPKLFNLNFRMFLGQWMQTIDFYKQEGFFFDAPDFRTYLPGIKSLKIGGNTSYILNPNFSFRAVGFQNEWQKQSAGSFIPSLQIYYTRFLLRDEIAESEENKWDISAGPGYYYNWVIGRHFIIGVGNTTGFGIEFGKDASEYSSSFIFNSQFRFSTGYNSERFFSGVNLSYNFIEQRDNAGIREDDRIHFIEFYLGYRIEAPKKWVKEADRINRKLGID